MPADLHSTLRDLALSFAVEIVRAARSATLSELFEPDVGEQRIDQLISRGAAEWGGKYKLSDVEVDILRRAALGESRVEMARRQGTSVRSVETKAASLLRRTRDGSLEGAANRLLRDLIDRSPRAVATAAPREGGGGGGGAGLQARIEQLRRLASGKPSDSSRYAMGAIVKELKSHPETYGERAVSVAAAAIGEDLAGLYRFATVAERWSAREVSTLLSSGNLSWSHLVALARVEPRPVRERLLRRARREGLPLRKLDVMIHPLVRRATK